VSGVTTPEALDAFLKLLRRNGVRRFQGIVDGDNMLLDFAASEPEQPTDTAPVAAKGVDLGLLKPELCNCAHEFTSHNAEGFCLNGCEPAQCEKAPAPAPTQADDTGT
jgi:hypothetical protein